MKTPHQNTTQGGGMTFLRFLSLLMFAAGFLFQPHSTFGATSADRIVYIVTTQKFTRGHPDYAPGSFLVDRCVFYEARHNGRNDKRMVYRTVDVLRSLKDYVVLDKHGNPSNIRYSDFEVLVDDYPNYYAGSPVPEGGCGSILIASAQKVTRSPKLDMEPFHKVLNHREKELYLQVLQQLPDWVTSQQRDDVRRHDFSNSFEKSKKSEIVDFFDGQKWFLVRSYFASMHVAPTQMSVLVLYQTEPQSGTLIPIIGYLGTHGGEGSLYLEAVGGFDVDNDGRNELLVLQHGWEWRGASYLRYTDGRWQ